MTITWRLVIQEDADSANTRVVEIVAYFALSIVLSFPNMMKFMIGGSRSVSSANPASCPSSFAKV